MPQPANAGQLVLVVGASGGIGAAVTEHFLRAGNVQVVGISRAARPDAFAYAGERLLWRVSDYSEASIAEHVTWIGTLGMSLHRVVICNGILHNERIAPEKSIARLSGAALQEVLHANTVVPALWVAALPRLLSRDARCVIAVLSARVGSITDNHLGGWHSYRASKAALNMIMKSASVEFARRWPGVKLLAFHPGTTDTALSVPFQRGVPDGKLFTPDFVAGHLGTLMDQLPADGELSYLAWDGTKIEW